MVEGSRIDHAGHANDPAAHLRDILAFNEASQVALEAARENENTLVLSVSDHETGGMTLGRNIDGDGIYAWKPGVVADVEASFGAIYNAVQADTANAVQIVREMTGVTDLTDAEQQSIRDHLSGYYAFNGVLSDIVSRRALVGWTTNGHTAVDVSVFAFGPGHHRFTGNRDNTYIGQTLADLLGFDLDAMTTAMREGETGGASTSR
jgi:alkaline phosphatase